MKTVDLIRKNEEAVRNIYGLYQSRMELGLTQKELSQLSGIGVSTLYEYETRGRIPCVRNYNKLAKVFGWEKILDSQTENPKKVVLSPLLPPKPVELPRPVKYEFIEEHIYGIYESQKKQDDNVNMFRYEGKQGIHHMFREVHGGWTRTYTDAQLIGKHITEVES